MTGSWRVRKTLFNAYGYDVVTETDGHGNVMRGARVINDAQAVIVRRIFQDYAAGKSAKKIAVSLNEDHVPCPTSGAWGFSTINGNRTRSTGILNNELYIGRLVWNRLHYLKDPKTGKRVSRLNPEAAWVIRDVPDLRILIRICGMQSRPARKPSKPARISEPVTVTTISVQDAVRNICSRAC